ncbi:MAG: HAD family phosphatase [Bacteroidota bacterium]
MDNPSQYKALLFDMDGTLVNTEPLHEEAWYDTLAQFNLQLSKDWFHRYTGSTDRKLMTHVIEHYGLSANVDDMLEEKRDRFLEIARTRSETFDGVKEGLTALQSKYRLALVTSSSRTGADHVLRLTGLTDFFETTITFNDVVHHKPHPEPYQKGAAFFGLSPNACIAVEDSVAGSASALAAGCYTIGVLNSVPAEKLSEVHQIIKTTEEVMDFLAAVKQS